MSTAAPQSSNAVVAQDAPLHIFDKDTRLMLCGQSAAEVVGAQGHIVTRTGYAIARANGSLSALGEVCPTCRTREQSPVAEAGETPATTGWGKPEDSAAFHFFAPRHGNLMLESVCNRLGYDPWFWSRTEPLDGARNLHVGGNCMGCRAWLAVPRNRREIGLSGTV